MSSFPKAVLLKIKVLCIPSYLRFSLLNEASTDSGTKPEQPQISSLPTPSTPRSPAARNPRTSRKIGPQATRLEALDDSLGPLGPLGDSAHAQEVESPPVPPSKEQSLPIRNARPTSSSHTSFSRKLADSSDLIDQDRSSIPPRQQPPPQNQTSFGGAENSRRQNQPSVSIEQASRPTFDITVGDPTKIGDLTSSHIVYQVRTKVHVNAPTICGFVSVHYF